MEAVRLNVFVRETFQIWDVLLLYEIIYTWSSLRTALLCVITCLDRPGRFVMIGENILTYLMDKGLNEMASYSKLCQTFGQAGEEICGILDDRFKDDDSFYYDSDRFDMSHMCMLAEKVQGAALDQADRIIWNYAYTIFLG